MKSLLLTFVIFIVVFSLMKIDVLSVLGFSAVRYTAYIMLFVVLCAGLYITFFPYSRLIKKQKQQQKEADHEKK